MCAPQYRQNISLSPLSRLIKLQRLFFTRRWFRLEVVNPSNQGWKTHQNGFGSTARLETENRSTVVEEVEFDIPSTSIKLVLTLIFAILFTHTAFCDRQVGFKKCIPHILNKSEMLFTVAFKVVEEDTAYATHLAAVL